MSSSQTHANSHMQEHIITRVLGPGRSGLSLSTTAFQLGHFTSLNPNPLVYKNGNNNNYTIYYVSLVRQRSTWNHFAKYKHHTMVPKT